MELVPFASVDPTALRWLRTSEAPFEFELRAGDVPVGRLVWARHGGSLATWSTAAGASTFKRIGFLHPHVTARTGTETTDTARVAVHLNGHRVEVRGGARYRLHRAGLLLPAWQVSADDGTEIVHVEPIREGRVLVGGAVISAAPSSPRPELPLLIALAWYVIVLSWFEDEALVPFESSPPTEAEATP